MKIASALLLLAASTALGVKTERWELNSPTDFMTGKLQRLAVSHEGELRLGYGSDKLGEFAKEVWCSIVAPDGTIYFGTGSPADVYAVGSDGHATKLLETDAIAVTALALDARGNVFAATMAEGKIFKVPRGKDKTGQEFCRLRAPYIWALAVDQQDHLLAGTGPDGKIYRVSPDAKIEEWYAAEESNILSLAFDADGALLAGSGDRGLLYRVAGKGQGVVLHEFGEDEIKAIAVSGRNLFIAANKQKVKRPRGPGRQRPSAAEFEDLTQRLNNQFGANVALRSDDQGRTTPPEARLANLLAGALYQRNADGRMDKLADWNDESICGLAVAGDGSVLAAMAGAGRLYRVRDSQHWELLFDFDEQQALTLATRDGRLAFVGTGNVGNSYLVAAQQANDGEFTSEVRDCRFLTTWGNLSWDGAGAIAVATRTGNTALPDRTWSEWSTALTSSPGRVSSPTARFIQIRAQLARASDPALRRLSLFYRMQNQKPEIAALEFGEPRKPMMPDRAKSKPGEIKPDAVDTGDVDVAGLKPTSSPAAEERKREEQRPKPASPLLRVHWRASDKDGDALVYRLFYQTQGDTVWLPVADTRDKPINRADYAWNTESMPDGWYRVKLVASDEESNPAGEALEAEQVSEPLKIDNGRPEITPGLAFDAAGKTLVGTARDALSLVQYLEYSVDGGQWHFFAPRDGLFDDREEPFAVKLDDLTPGPHAVAVRATDENGNIGVAKVTIRVP
jgi:hypothetical protein